MPARCSAWRGLRLLLGAVMLGLALACAPAALVAAPAAAPGPAAAPRAAGAAPAAPPPATNPYLAAPGEPRVAVKVGTCSLGGSPTQLYTALEGGLYDKYGLAVERVLVQGVAPALAALASNEVQFLYCAVDGTIGGLASGVEGKIIAAPLAGLPYVLIARPDVRAVADLRGKSISITRAGDLDDRVTRLALEHHGLRPNEDVELRPLGGSQPDRDRAMLTDVVQGTVITPPLDAQATHDGMNVLYRLADLGIPWIPSAVHTNNVVLREQPRVVQRFVAASVEAVHFTAKNPAVARAALRRVLDLDDPGVLDAAYEAYALRLAAPRATISFDALAATIEALRASGGTVTVRGPEDVAVNTFVDDLERTGFLQALWGSELPAR
jgi:ABC-type nitrate/sulfonate/bicarbonate transport system substrate-binding protein